MDIISSEVLFAPAPLVRADARPRTPCTSLTRAVVRPTARLHLRDASCSVVRRLRAPVACGCRRQLHCSSSRAAYTSSRAAHCRRTAAAPVRGTGAAAVHRQARPNVSSIRALAGQRCLSGRDRRLVARAQSQDIDAVCERTHAKTCTSVPATPTEEEEFIRIHRIL